MTKTTKNGSPASRRAGRSFHLWLRWGVLLLVVLVCALLLHRGNTMVKLTAYELPMQHLPAAFDGFTIAHLSDLHNASFGADQQRLLSVVREANADIIVITGDTIDSRHTNVVRAVDTIETLCEIAPVYLVTGNHEARNPDACEALLAGAAAVGAVVLRNDTVTLERMGERITLAGVDDLGFFAKLYGMADGETRMKQELAALTRGEGLTILFSHRPELFPWYAAAGADLVLTGHAHGGQIRLPWIGGLIAPGQGLLPKYTEGIHRMENTWMEISRGLGNSIFPLRINNPPEVVALTLYCE